MTDENDRSRLMEDAPSGSETTESSPHGKGSASGAGRGADPSNAGRASGAISSHDASLPAKVAPAKRFTAAAIDGGIALGISLLAGLVMFIPVFGGLLACLSHAAAGGYLLIRDSLNDGRSFGKKSQGLTVQTPTGAPCTLEQSIYRNLLIGAPSVVMALLSLFMMIPFLGFLVMLVSAPIALVVSIPALYELVQVATLDPKGHRLMETRQQCFTVEE